MAFRFLPLLVHFAKLSHPFPSKFSSISTSLHYLPNSFYSEEPFPDGSKTFSSLDERHVLEKLSEFLPVAKCTSQNPILKHHESKSAREPVDGFLSPEEKLRGVFLQKLNGKAAIEKALSNVGVDLNIDVLGRVVNSGNFGGEAMVAFFNWAIKQPGLPKDIGSYRVIVKALGRRKFFNFMMEVLDDMKVTGLEADLQLLSIVIDSFVRAGHVSKAIQVFNNLDDLGLKHNAEALNVFLSCLCQRSHMSAASSVYNSMKGKVSFDVTTYSVVAGGWSKLGGVNEIERITNEMEEMQDCGYNSDIEVYECIITGLCNVGQLDNAVLVMEESLQKGFCPSRLIYSKLSNRLLASNKTEIAYKLFLKIKHARSLKNARSFWRSNGWHF
ncbi:hypothetical protein PIB30_034457 [Stylosanthes scabra]|uniref:Pentatricopeptide repeat-containing protein n=1 Tax=Stylosanthes scabra TaxID=79078 RepID=A0ABU6UD00_9FABA|nr:hypothetical protein [Stylosanthes scabra]